ncbi:uncharacterized protein LOC108917248 [Anoplophora glabripennis]|uniref:Uncharacterized protein n=1 Tax=Anoplophora glabripennis TaxID=217634 RepID=V5GXX0_ANOGL|nr:uncharacterized protein LOC108917248 [Anoplophora glabripennis]
MVCKLAVVLFVAIFAVFVQTHAVDNDDVPQVRNDAEKLLEKLEAAVDEALVQAQQALDDARNKVDQTAAAIEASAESEMKSTEDKFREELDKLKEKAANAGVNIDDCLAGNEDKLVNLPNVFTEDMVHCVSDRIDQGISYAQDALDAVKKVVEEVENIKQEIKDCGHGLKAVKCLAKLALQIEKDITSLPTKIEADVAATVALIAQLEDKVKECASTKVDECESEGEKTLAIIAACVASKIIT